MANISMSRRALLAAAGATPLLASAPAWAQAGPVSDAILATMKRATRFMTDEVAVAGGYVWNVLPDFSRRWGELEASPTMIWVQPPGTATVGHLFLDAYHATGDEQFYDAAVGATLALARGQHSAGGWNYVIDTAGEDSLRRWYDTIGKNAWRLEEFQKHHDNATFDDAGTAEASQLMLRMYLEKRDRRFREPLDKAIAFVLNSQYPNGGWPQRYPHVENGSLHGQEDYTGHITFNDDVAGENIEFLLFAYQALGDRRLPAAIRRAMDIFILTQQPQPQPAWGLQHFADSLKPAGARTYEPKALATHTTAANLRSMIGFYLLTADDKYLARIPEALDWLDQVAVTAALRQPGRTHPTFILEGANTPIYVHRKGSNITNGAYYADANPDRVVGHYGSFRNIDTAAIRADLAAARARSIDDIRRTSPLLARPRTRALPPYFTLKDVDPWDLGGTGRSERRPDAGRIAQLTSSLNDRGYWPSPMTNTSNPYIGAAPAEVTGGEYQTTNVGDLYDTSPYRTDYPVETISTSGFVRNMGELIELIASRSSGGPIA